MAGYETARVLIWGKTYPELSTKYGETVCTAGCLENGRPIRIYPVPFRLLEDYKKYSLYQWVRAPIRRRTQDPRPESYEIDAGKIVSGKTISTDPGWMKRRAFIEKNASWHFNTVKQLKEAQRQSDQSLGLVEVADVLGVDIEKRSKEKEGEHTEQLKAARSQGHLFDDGKRPWLNFQKYRVRVTWRCGTPGNPHPDCNGHDMAILDWGLGELTRREGPEKARQKIESISDTRKYELKFFLGNMQQYPQSFTIVGLWYPKRADVERRSSPLFS